MIKKKIMIIEDNVSLASLLSDKINLEEDMEVIECLNDGENAVKSIIYKNPDIIILDMFLPNEDGLTILEKLKATSNYVFPLIIIISSPDSDIMVKKAITLGATYYVMKPFTTAALIERMRDLKEEQDRSNKKYNSKLKKGSEMIIIPKQSLEMKVTTIIQNIGVPAHIKGYQYIREAVIMVVNDEDIINAVTKVLYPALSEKFNSTPSRVERAIRHAIEVSWNRGHCEVQEEIFGYSVNSKRGKPTNSEFVAMISDKLRLEEKYMK